jgi:tetratricopeptide (TPR) repeat protein
VRDGRISEAEAHAVRASAILAKTTGPDYPDLAVNLFALARIRTAQRRYEEAEPLLKRSLEITAAGAGPQDSSMAPQLAEYAKVLRKMSRKAEASRIEAQAKAIFAK